MSHQHAFRNAILVIFRHMILVCLFLVTFIALSLAEFTNASENLFWIVFATSLFFFIAFLAKHSDCMFIFC